MKSIVFFNNKGGVGKTTLSCNIASFLGGSLRRRVLLIDADPQCNATQICLEDELLERIYYSAPGSQTLKTLYDVCRPIQVGEATIDQTPAPIDKQSSRFRVDIVPGHPRMSILEDTLSDAWEKLKGGGVGGCRVSNWCSQLLGKHASHYDLIIFDVGPSLGALNRTILLASDFIVTPFGCDIFSMLGIKNIAEWVREWDQKYHLGLQNIQQEDLAPFPVVRETSNRFRLIGFSIQQYVARTFKTGKRPVKAYDEIIREIPGVIGNSLAGITPAQLQISDLNLGNIPFLYSLVPLAQTARSPIHELTSDDGLVGAHYAAVNEYKETMKSICERLLANIGRVNG